MPNGDNWHDLQLRDELTRALIQIEILQEQLEPRRQLVSRLNRMIASIADTNSYDKADLVDLLKTCRDALDTQPEKETT